MKLKKLATTALLAISVLLLALFRVIKSEAQSQLPPNERLLIYQNWPALRIWSIDTAKMQAQQLVDLNRNSSLSYYYIDYKYNIIYLIYNPYGVPYGKIGYLVQYDWMTHIEQVVYERENLAEVNAYGDDTHLLVNFYQAGLLRPYPGIGPESCLLSIETWQCTDYVGEVGKRLGLIYPVTWLDGENFLQTDYGNIDLVNTEVGSITTIVDFPLQVVDQHLQRLTANNVLFVAYQAQEGNTVPLPNGTVSVYSLNTSTNSVSLLFSIDGLGDAKILQVSPDKTMLFAMWPNEGYIFNIKTGISVLHVQRAIDDTKLGQVVFDDSFRWSSDSAGLFAEATINSVINQHALVYFNLSEDNIIPIVTMDAPFDFVPIPD